MPTINIKIGAQVWLDCEVKPGAFSNERIVTLESKFCKWSGFVNDLNLQNAISEGKSKVKALIIDIIGDKFHAQVPGESLGTSVYVDSLERLTNSVTI